MGRVFALTVLLSVSLSAKSPQWDRAHELYLRTEYKESLAILQNIEPKDAPTLELTGQDYFMLGDYKKSTDVLEKAAGLDPNRASIYHWLGRAFGRRAEMSSPFTAPAHATHAREMFEKALALDPTNKDIAGDLMDFYLEAPGFLGGGLNKAEKLAEQISKTDPAEGHYALAQIDEKRKEYDSAEKHLRHAAELAPRQVGRVLDMAMYLAKHGKIKESEALFDQAQRMEPNSPKVLFDRASTYVNEKRNLDEAKQLLQRYLRCPLTPDDPPRERAEAMLKKIGA